MHGALPIEESLRAARPKHAFVPYVRVNVESLVAAEPEADKLLRRDIIARERQRHVEGLVLKRKEQLTTIRVVVRMLQEDAPRLVGVILTRRLRC
jgi:hypothetical protein